MTAEEKLMQTVRDYLITQKGIAFLKLSEKDQNNLILAVIQDHFEKERGK